MDVNKQPFQAPSTARPCYPSLVAEGSDPVAEVLAGVDRRTRSFPSRQARAAQLGCCLLCAHMLSGVPGSRPPSQRAHRQREGRRTWRSQGIPPVGTVEGDLEDRSVSIDQQVLIRHPPLPPGRSRPRVMRQGHLILGLAYGQPWGRSEPSAVEGGAVNDEHLRLCASAEWAALVRDDLLPWVLGHDDLGDDVLELGAGPGLVTDLLVERAPHVTAVEIDEQLATALRVRMAGRPVEVVTADATSLAATRRSVLRRSLLHDAAPHPGKRPAGSRARGDRPRAPPRRAAPRHGR